jgi:hypothetical protein
MQSAFSAGPLQFSLPAISAGEPLVGILLGIIVFGDRIQITPGLLALEAGGIAALIVGVIAVARAPALSALHRWTPHGMPHGLSHVPRLHHHGHPPANGVSSANGTGKSNGAGTARDDSAPDSDRVNDAPTAQRPQRDMRGLRRPGA